MARSDTLHFIDVDVTGLVQDWASGYLDNHGLALRGVESGAVNVVFDTKESFLTSHAPELEVALRGAASRGRKGDRSDRYPGSRGPAGPASTQGHQGDPGRGPQGPASAYRVRQGPAGPEGPRGLTTRGAWDAVTSCAPDDLATDAGQSWLAVAANTNSQPVRTRAPTGGSSPRRGRRATQDAIRRGRREHRGPRVPPDPRGTGSPRAAGPDRRAGSTGTGGAGWTAGSARDLRARGLPSGASILGAPGDTTLIGAGFTELDAGLETWTSTRLLGAPAPRMRHTAVWTGTTMIVWGGKQLDYQTGRISP